MMTYAPTPENVGGSPEMSPDRPHAQSLSEAFSDSYAEVATEVRLSSPVERRQRGVVRDVDEATPTVT